MYFSTSVFQAPYKCLEHSWHSKLVNYEWMGTKKEGLHGKPSAPSSRQNGKPQSKLHLQRTPEVAITLPVLIDTEKGLIALQFYSWFFP